MRKQNSENEEVKDPSIRKKINLTPAQVQQFVLRLRAGEKGLTPQGLIKDDHERWYQTVQGIQKGIEPWFEFFLEEFDKTINRQVHLLGYYPGIDQEDVDLEARMALFHALRKEKDLKINTLPGLVKTFLVHWFSDYCTYLNRHVRNSIKFKKTPPPDDTPPDDTPPDDTPPDDTPPDGTPPDGGIPTKQVSQAWPAKEGLPRLEETTSPSPEKQVCDVFLKQLIHKHVKELPKIYRVIIKGCYRYNKTDVELARILNSKRLTILRARKKAEQMLRSPFIKAGIQPDM